jgi:hypothetical protein
VTGAPHGRARALVDRHFAGRGTPRSDAEMRTHQDGCVSCRAHYDHHALLASLDPVAPAAKERLARGLGFAARPRRRRWWALWPAAALAPVAAAVWLYAGAGEPVPTFAARGVAGDAPPAPALHVVRVLGPSQFVPLGAEIAADEALAFAHGGPGGLPYLMVVAVDEEGRRYWFHPDVERERRSVAIAGGAGAELGEAGRHRYRGRALRILGLFSRQPLQVDQVDAVVDASGCAGAAGRLPQVTCVEQQVRVESEGQR